MATRRKKNEYTRQAVTSKIAVTSRGSVKIKDNYFTVEYSEERLIPEGIDVDIEKERQMLWDDCNTEIDNQIEDIYKNLK